MKDRHWNSLVESLKHGRCILVLGPEIAADWSESGRGADAQTPATFAGALKERLADELREGNIDPSTAGSLAAVAQLYEDADAQGFGAANLHSQAARFYASLPLKPSKDHEALASLPFPLIVSTCHDQLLTNALTQAGKDPLVGRYHFKGETEDEREKPFPRPTPSAPVVYHLFGTSQDARTLVLSENDLLDFVVAMVSDRPPVPSWLRRELQAPGVSLLFVGFGISQWYQRILVKALIRFLSGGLSNKNGAVAVALDPYLQTVPDPERTQTILFYERGNRVEVSDENVPRLVAELQQRLEKAGGVAEKVSAVRRPRVFISYVKENDALAAAVFDTLKRADLEPWLDAQRLRGGEDWDQTVKEELRGVDYVLVLVTPELVRKKVGYVNTEINLALKRATEYRDRFVIPLISDRLGKDERIPTLRDLHETPFRESDLGAALAPLAKDLVRELQLRNR